VNPADPRIAADQPSGRSIFYRALTNSVIFTPLGGCSADRLQRNGGIRFLPDFAFPGGD